MNAMFRKTLLAGAITALAGSPVWAAGTDADKDYKTPSASEQSTQSGSSMERGATAGSGSAEIGSTASNPIYSMTPQQLRKMDVVDATGEKIGEVDSVVRSRSQGEEKIHAVISSGGVLGMGAKKVTMSLDELQLVDEKLHVSATEEELKARPEFVEDQYVELQPADQPISEFAAFEPVPDTSDPARTPAAPDPNNPTQGGSTTPMSPTPDTAPSQ